MFAGDCTNQVVVSLSALGCRDVTQLRLARALVQLPRATDRPMLALDFGFASHSHSTRHFAAALAARLRTFGPLRPTCVSGRPSAEVA